jgi:hypothetical protein
MIKAFGGFLHVVTHRRIGHSMPPPSTQTNPSEETNLSWKARTSSFEKLDRFMPSLNSGWFW